MIDTRTMADLLKLCGIHELYRGPRKIKVDTIIHGISALRAGKLSEMVCNHTGFTTSYQHQPAGGFRIWNVYYD